MDNQKVIGLAHTLQALLPFGCSGINSMDQYDQAIELMGILEEDAIKNAFFIDYLLPIIERYEDTSPDFFASSNRIAKMDMAQIMLRVLVVHYSLKTSDFINEIGDESIVIEIINGKRELTNAEIKKLAARFNLTPEAFFDKQGNIDLRK